MDKRTKLRIKLWARDLYKLLLFIFIAVACGWAFSSFLSLYLLNLSNPKHQVNERAIQNIGTIYRAQQSHFFERRNFARNYDELGFTPQNIKNYQLTIKNTDNSAFTYAVPTTTYIVEKKWLFLSYVETKQFLYSYVGGISYSSQDSTFSAILCVNNKPGQHVPNSPKLVDNNLICSAGTTQINE